MSLWLMAAVAIPVVVTVFVLHTIPGRGGEK